MDNWHSNTLTFPLDLLEEAFGNCEVKLEKCDYHPNLTTTDKEKLLGKLRADSNLLYAGTCTTLSFKNCPYSDFKLVLVHDQLIEEGWSNDNARGEHVYYANFNNNFIEIEPTKRAFVERKSESDSDYESNNSNQDSSEGDGVACNQNGEKVEDKFECKKCKYTFTKNYNLKRHQKNGCTGKPYRPIKSTVKSQQQLVQKSHIRGMKFKGSKTLRAHQTVHSQKRPYGCTTCGLKFKESRTLRAHEMIHTGIKPFKCELCLRRFLRKDSLKNHMLCHSDVKSFHCSKCDARFKLASSLRAHQAVHSQMRPYGCTTCGKKFKCSRSLREHQAVHSQMRPYGCTTCGKKFKCSKTLHSHQAVHSQMRPYGCTTCGLKFKDSKTLRAHEMIHIGIKRYKCEVCFQRFLRRGSLVSHMISHSDVKSFHCSKCDARFKSAKSLRAHNQKRHPLGRRRESHKTNRRTRPTLNRTKS